MSKVMLHLTRSNHFADGQLPLSVIRRKPQEPFPLHTHDFSELVIILSGTGTHFSQTDEYSVIAGDAFVIEGNSSHGYRNVKGLELVNILFDAVQLGVPVADLRAIPGLHSLMSLEAHYHGSDSVRKRLCLEPRELEHAESLVASLEREFRDKRPGYHSLAAAYFLQIVGYLARCFTDRSWGRTGPILGLADAVSFLEENVTRRISVRELVEVSRMSESTLLRHFTKAFGTSPSRYHLHLKIERACRLLARPELSITEVSFRSGFSDSNYFSRQFRRAKHCTPREYRHKAAVTPTGLIEASGNA